MKITLIGAKVLLFLVVLAVGLFFASSDRASAAEKQKEMIELKFQLYQSPVHMVTVNTRRVTKYVNKLFDGRVKITVYDSGVLAKGHSLHNAVQKGVVDIGSWMAGFATEKNLPFLLLAGLPGIYRDTVGFIDAWEKEETLDKLTEEYFVESGYDQLKLFGTYNVGHMLFAFKNKQPKVPNDFKPLKIRATGSWLALLRQMGVNTVSVPIGQTYEALERGIIDGTQVVGSLLIDWKLAEPASYLLDQSFGFGALNFLMNKSSYAKLSDLDKDIIIAYFRWLRDALNKAYLEYEISARNKYAKMLEIYTPNAEERKAWESSFGPFVDNWLKLVGDRGRKALEVVKKYN